MSLHKPRRHRGRRPGSTAALPPSRPNRTSVFSIGRTPDQPTSPASPIPTALPEAPTASKPNPVPNPQPPTFPAQTGGQRPRGPDSPNLLQRVRAARLPPQASIWPPSCRRVLGLRTAAVLAGHGNQTSGPRAASRPLPPPSRLRRVWRPAPHQQLCRSPHKRDGARSLNGTSCGTPGVSLYSHRKPRPPRDPSAEMRSGTTF